MGMVCCGFCVFFHVEVRMGCLSVTGVLMCARPFLCENLFFFFQAEDGIRDLTVTGVQTCALPICGYRLGWPSDAPFDSFTIQAGNHEGVAETFDLDNLRMSLNTTPLDPTPTATPEPATLALVATALASVPFIRRRFSSGA